MPQKTVGRDKIAKKYWDGRCYDAETVRPAPEGTQAHMYVYCRGLSYAKCHGCPAWAPKEDYEEDSWKWM